MSDQLTIEGEALSGAGLPPIGSRWYMVGHHWQVTAHTTRDGEPAIAAKCLTGTQRKAQTFRFIWRLVERKAAPSGRAD